MSWNYWCNFNIPLHMKTLLSLLLTRKPECNQEKKSPTQAGRSLHHLERGKDCFASPGLISGY
jgi:hypothetical protein